MCVVVGEQVEVVRLWLTDWNMWLYELYDILSLNGNVALDHIFTMVYTSYDRHTYLYIILYTQCFPCNFHMRPYLQFVGVISKAPFESRQRRSPDMDEAPSQGGCVSDFAIEMFDEFDEGVWCPAAMDFSTKSLLLQNDT